MQEMSFGKNILYRVATGAFVLTTVTGCQVLTEPKPKSEVDLVMSTDVVVKTGVEQGDALDFKAVRPAIGSCQVKDYLPDPECTPGSVFKNVGIVEICTPNYTEEARKVSEGLKARIYQLYGIFNRLVGQYEIDHLVSLAIGGSNTPANLWPQSTTGSWNTNMKDQLTIQYLRRKMCAERWDLARIRIAQRAVANNWIEEYKKAFAKS